MSCRRKISQARLAAVHAIARSQRVDVVVLYSDVWRSNDARYLSNYRRTESGIHRRAA